MAVCDSQQNDKLLKIVEGVVAPQFAEQFSTTTLLDGRLKDLLTDFFTFADECVNIIHQKEGYNTSDGDKAEVSNVCREAFSILREPNNLNYILDSTLFSFYSFQKYKKSSHFLLKEAGLIDNDSGFKLVTKGHKRHRSADNSIIPKSNKYSNLDNDVNLDDNSKMDQSPASNPTELVAGTSKHRINPFYIEFDQKWTELAKSISDLNKDKPLISLKGERLMVLCKTDDDFRATQDYLDKHTLKYTTLHPRDQRPKKICIRGLPPFTEQNLIAESLKDYGFIVTRAAMMKNRKTGQPMPMYMVNVLPCKNFEDIYKIKVIAYISVTIEAFKSQNQIKQCYRCQGFGHASEVCKFTPKCLRCAEKHWTKECPHEGKITPTCANCGQVGHPATFRGCSKHPLYVKYKQTQKTDNPQKNNNTTSKDSLMFVEVLKDFNYTKKQSQPENKTPKAPQTVSSQNDSTISNETQVLGTQPTSCPSSTENSTNYTNSPTSSYTNDVQEIFKTFQDIKELFQIAKFLKCIKNISNLSKKCSNPMDKMLIIIKEFDTLASELNIPHDV